MGIFFIPAVSPCVRPFIRHKFVYAQLLDFTKRFSQNFASIVERFTNRYIILIGLFLMELLPFLLHLEYFINKLVRGCPPSL